MLEYKTLIIKIFWVNKNLGLHISKEIVLLVSLLMIHTEGFKQMDSKVQRTRGAYTTVIMTGKSASILLLQFKTWYWSTWKQPPLIISWASWDATSLFKKLIFLAILII